MRVLWRRAGPVEAQEIWTVGLAGRLGHDLRQFGDNQQAGRTWKDAHVSGDDGIAEARVALGRQLAAARKAAGLGQHHLANKIPFSAVFHASCSAQHARRKAISCGRGSPGLTCPVASPGP